MPRSRPKKILDNQPATPHDLEVWGNQLGLRIGNLEKKLDENVGGIDDNFKNIDRKFEGIDKKFVSLEQKIEEVGDKIMRHIDAAIENRASDLLGVTSDEVKLIKDKTANHEERIVTLEKHAGVR